MGKPPLRTRATLPLARLEGFANWARQAGYTVESPRGREVLRLREEPHAPLLYYLDGDGESVKCIGFAAVLVHRWRGDRQMETQGRATA